MTEHSRGGGLPQRAMEVVVALATTAFAVAMIVGSLQAGIDWGAEGPKAGFFPFYVGLAILCCSSVNVVEALSMPSGSGVFAEWGQLGQVMSMLVPTALYVALIPWTGIYVASALLIALFMRWLGNYGWGIVAAIAIGVPLVTFVIFEKWFLVPLPKGPLEAALGF